MTFFLFPMVDPVHKFPAECLLGTGSRSAAGAVSGRAVFSIADAQELHGMGVPSILIVNDPTSAELEGFAYTNGVVSMHGGVTSPAADIARARTIPAVTAVHGCGMVVDEHNQCVVKNGEVCISKNDEITVDGSNGRVIKGVVSTVEAGMDLNFLTFMQWVQKYKRLGVFCNAKSLDDATKGADLGADGLGMYRTETVLTQPANKDLFLGVLMCTDK